MSEQGAKGSSGAPPAVQVRATTVRDIDEVLALYLAVAASDNGLARAAREIDRGYVASFVSKSVAGGVGLVAVEDRAAVEGRRDERIVGEIHAYSSPLAVFAHVLGELTIAVHPGVQRRGVGRALFTELLRIVRDDWPRIERVELITRESSVHAIALYESLGFRREGRLEKRIQRVDGALEADVPMGWCRRP